MLSTANKKSTASKKKTWLFANFFLVVAFILFWQKGLESSHYEEQHVLSSYLNLLLPLLPSHPSVEEEGLGPFVETPPMGSVKSYTFRRGDSFFLTLVRLGVSREETDTLIRSGKKIYNLSRVFPGQQMRLMVEPTSGAVHWLEYEIGNLKRIKFVRDGEGFQVTSERIPLETEVRFAEGLVVSNLYDAAKEAGVPKEVILDFADLFVWDVNFSEETLPGDRFRVVYEILYRDGEYYDTGKILAAEIVHRGKKLRAFYYTPDGKKGDYYDPAGRSTKKAFLKSPLRYRYISSGFSYNRYHPILRVRRPHLGVDYAAPMGTPVMAAADGTIRFMGRKGGLGNRVVIQHLNGYRTLYGHLKSFASGLKVGQKIEQSTIIGYVGSTGISTGPHLHYTFKRNNVPIDPIRAVGKMATEHLSKKELEKFRRQIAPFQHWMETFAPNAV